MRSSRARSTRWAIVRSPRADRAAGSTITIGICSGSAELTDHSAFRAAVAASAAVDPLPTFERLGNEVGVPVEDLVHHALVRWVSAGSEALMALEPQVLRDLVEARRREDWGAVAGIIDWLESGS